jgi:hypothetical protein
VTDLKKEIALRAQELSFKAASFEELLAGTESGKITPTQLEHILEENSPRLLPRDLRSFESISKPEILLATLEAIRAATAKGHVNPKLIGEITSASENLALEKHFSHLTEIDQKLKEIWRASSEGDRDIGRGKVAGGSGARDPRREGEEERKPELRE